MTDSGVEYRANPRFNADNVSIKFGTGGDSRLYYDGTDLVISPAEVGVGDLKLTGAGLLLDSGEGLDFGVGDVTLAHASDKLTLAGGDLHVADGNGLVIGHSSQYAHGALSLGEFQMLGTGALDSEMVLGTWSNDPNGFTMGFSKSRGTSIGSNGLVANGDTVFKLTGYANDGVDDASWVGQIKLEIDGTPGANDVPGRLVFLTTADGASGSTERVRIDSSGRMLINDTANSDMTVGLTINQGSNDDDIISLKSSDVAHGITSLHETDTYGGFGKFSGDTGGMAMYGYREGDGMAIQLFGRTTLAADTTKTIGASGVIDLDGQVKSGTTVQAIGANGNIVTIATNGTARFIFDTEGSAHADIEWTTYDTYDDLALIADIESELLRREDDSQTDRRHALEATGIIGKNSWHFENGKPRAMVNTTRLAMLHHGALIQVADRFDEYETRIAGLERRLLAAGD